MCAPTSNTVSTLLSVQSVDSVLFTNDHLCKIGYVTNPNCIFCHQLELTDTISHILFRCSFSNSFWHEVNKKNFE